MDWSDLRGTCTVFLTVTTWISLFVFGVTVNSDAYLTAISSSGTVMGAIPNLAGYVLSGTWTNVLCLCVMASLAGEFSPDAIVRSRLKPVVRAAVALGFLVFLGIATGQSIIMGNISLPESVAAADDGGVPTVSPGQYFRVATFGSLFSFLLGLRPRVVAGLVAKILSRTPGEEQGSKADQQWVMVRKSRNLWEAPTSPASL